MNRIVKHSPIDGSLIGECSISPESEIYDKVGRANDAWRVWERCSLSERKKFFMNLRKVLYKERHEIAELITREQGKPILESYLAEILPSFDTLSYLIEKGEKLLRPQRTHHFTPILSGKQGWYAFRPYGVFACIAPWNYPFAIPFIQLSVLLFAGNTCVFKPSPVTPFTGEKIVELFRKAEFPEGTLEIVHGGAHEGETLLKDERVRGVVFTGSVNTGKRVMEISSQTLKKVILELGGNDPALVLDDAHLERTVRGVTWAAFMNAGQTCASIERVYVEKRIFNDFVHALKEEVEKIRVGDPFQSFTDMGPLAVDFQFRKVVQHVEDAREKGATILTGGHPLEGLYYPPTLITHVNEDMLVLREETFGPVVCVDSFETDEEALRKANSTAYGLTASVWSRNRERVKKIVSELDAGVVTVNNHVFSFAEPESAWGGFKYSGVGRTHGRYGLLECVQVQYIDYEWSTKPELWYFPYTEKLQSLISMLMEFFVAPNMFIRTSILFRFLPHLSFLNKHLPLQRVLPAFFRKLL